MYKINVFHTSLWLSVSVYVNQLINILFAKFLIYIKCNNDLLYYNQQILLKDIILTLFTWPWILLINLNHLFIDFYRFKNHNLFYNIWIKSQDWYEIYYIRYIIIYLLFLSLLLLLILIYIYCY